MLFNLVSLSSAMGLKTQKSSCDACINCNKYYGLNLINLGPDAKRQVVVCLELRDLAKYEIQNSKY